MDHSPTPARSSTKAGFTDKTQLSSLIREDRVRMNALPTIGEGTEAFFPNKPDTSVQIEENRQSGAISDELAALLDAIVDTIPPNYTSKTGILKSKTVQLNPFHAKESRPDVSELGVNEYSTLNEDNRRYGFDTGFLRRIIQENLRFRPSPSHRPQTLVKFLKNRTNKFITSTLLRKTKDIQRKYSQLFSLGHRLDRMGKSRKYVEAWVTQAGLDLNLDEEEYRSLPSIIPTSWMRDAEREVLARHHATRQRDEFKKEVAA
ncbi:hypothetical protein LOD99_10271 [Oopsacas minuta]|uniref:Uncharacterized protein n=1 Tax=Oopsacas minuta TaxID=111878 RepID=A0AAV7KI03_9METZ|nr:hypothetical protein LOD99_10271 [Oopsacas minuta]